MNNFLIGLAAFIIVVIAALFGIPKFIDWNAYRGVFEEEATRFIGRDVRVSGAVNLKLLPTPYFSFEKVRVADNDTSTGEPFFKADAVTVWLSVTPFLRGAIEASEIELKRPSIRLVLNAEGGGNWQTFRAGQSTLPFTPKDVLLQSVRLTDGTLTVNEVDGTERVGFSAINGELATAAIDGPYRFRGSYGVGDAQAELRLSTLKPEPDGSIRIKTSHKTAASGVSVAFDGRIANLDASPHIDGELTAQAPMVRSKTAPPPPPGQQAEQPLELKAQIAADTQTFKLKDLALTFEQLNRPQSLTGEATGRWASGISATVELATQWLDLDQLIGLAEQQSPLTALLDATQNLRSLTPTTATVAATVTIEQANLGREAINGVRLAISSKAGALKIDDMKLGLPGGSRADVQGQFPPGSAAFDGDVTLRGSSASRFLSWMSGGAVALAPSQDGVFAVRSHITSGPGSLVAREFSGEMGPTVVTGNLDYTWLGRPHVSVQLDGAQLDLGTVLAADVDLGQALTTAWPDMDATVKIQVGKVLLPGRVYTDVTADFDLKDRRLAINQVQLTADTGFALELEGDVRDVANKPRGTLRGVVSASTKEGVAALLQALGAPDHVVSLPVQASAVLPVRLAGSVNFGASVSDPVIISTDGTLGAVRVQGSARLAKGFASWASAHGDYNLSLDAAEPQAILAILGRVPMSLRPSPKTQVADAGLTPRGSSQFRAVAAGVVADGLAALITLDAPDTALAFRGTLGTNDKGLKIAGDVTARSENGQQVMQLLPGWDAIDLTGVPIDGVARIDLADDTTRLQRIALNIATTSVSGDLTVTPIVVPGQPIRRRLEGRLDAGDVPISTLFAPVLHSNALKSAPSARPAKTSIWPESTIDFTRLDGLEGALDITAGRLLLDDGLGLDDVKLGLVFGSKLIELRALEGDALGGRWVGSWRLERIAGGAQLSGALRVTLGRLEALAISAGRSGAATGVFNGVLTLSGRGTSLANIFAASSGSGNLDLGDAQIGHLPPQGVISAIDAAMSGAADGFGANLRQKLLTGRETMRLALSPRVWPFDVADGALRFRPTTFDLVDGLVRPALAVDMSTLDVLGTWGVEVRPSQASIGNVKPGVPTGVGLPAITFTTIGRLSNLAKSETRLNSETLERELAVRKMERDLLELERLRKLDEDRARADAARKASATPASPSDTPGGGFETVVTPTAPIAPVTPGDAKAPAASDVKPAPAPRPVSRPRASTQDYRPFDAEQLKSIAGGG
jgi:uncharacterized protein involved in outer membrane biogenesis